MTTNNLRTIDLFAGAGGLTEGFRLAGYEAALATDFDEHAAATFRHNFPGVPFLTRSVFEISGAEFLDQAGFAQGELDVLLGGPPCQAFSVYNHQRGLHDDRSGLFREYLRVVEAFMPRAIVMENVTGMFSIGDGAAIKEIHERLEGLGYVVEHKVLKAEEFGVPQERRRLFFIGTRDGAVSWPRPSHMNGFVTVGQAISDLPLLRNGEGDEGPVPYTRKTRCQFQEDMRVGSEGVHNHVAPRLHPINLQRMHHIPQGGSWRDVPRGLLPAGMKKARRCDHTKRYGRLLPNGLFSTILTKADLHWGAFIHPDQDRTLTVRECARAQTFGDAFVFRGSRMEQHRQVGNAVPPRLAFAVAQEVARMLQRETQEKRARVAVS